MTRARSISLVALLSVPLVSPVYGQRAGALPPWQLSAAPVIRIGEEGDPNREFQRVVGVVRMPSGEIVVGNAGSQELRVFSPEGGFRRSMSRRGEGPGELQTLGSMIRSHDTVFVVELTPGGSQLHTFTLGDGFVSRTLLRPSDAPRGVSALGRFSTGDLLVQQGGFAAVVPPPLGTLRRDSITLGVLHGGHAGDVSWIGTFPNNTWFSYNLSAGPARTTLSRFSLGPSMIAVVIGDRVWIGDTGTGMIRIFDAGGKPIGTFTVPIASRSFSDAALARAKARALELVTTPDARSRVEALYGTDISPRTTPRFGRLLAGAGGEVWMQAYEEDSSAPTQVTVLSAEGRAIARLTIPPNVTIHEVGADYVVGVETDSDGVQQIVQFRLRRE